MYRVVIVEDDPMVSLLNRTFVERAPASRWCSPFRTAGPPWLNSRRAGTPTPTRCAACWREGIPVARECVNEYLETVGGQIRLAAGPAGSPAGAVRPYCRSGRRL